MAAAPRLVFLAIPEPGCTSRRTLRAEAWRTEIAKEWWDSEFRGDERPSDDEIGAVYFDRMRDGGEEFFSINACELE